MMAAPAKFMPVSDILLQVPPGLPGVVIRTIGRLFECEPTKNLIWIQDPKKHSDILAVDCSKIAPFPFQNGLLYQFIGEVDCSRHKAIIIKALLYRNCQGLDTDIYIQTYMYMARQDEP